MLQAINELRRGVHVLVLSQLPRYQLPKGHSRASSSGTSGNLLRDNDFKNNLLTAYGFPDNKCMVLGKDVEMARCAIVGGHVWPISHAVRAVSATFTLPPLHYTNNPSTQPSVQPNPCSPCYAAPVATIQACPDPCCTCFQAQGISLLSDGSSININHNRNGILWAEPFERAYTAGALAIGVDDHGQYTLVVLCRLWASSFLWDNCGVSADVSFEWRKALPVNGVKHCQLLMALFGAGIGHYHVGWCSLLMLLCHHNAGKN